MQLGQNDLADLTTPNPLGVAGIEDIIPFGVAVAAAHVYCQEFVPTVDVVALQLDQSQVYDDAVKTSPNRGTLKYLESAIGARTGTPSFHLDKVAFSRAVIDVLAGKMPGLTAAPDDIKVAHENFRILLTALAKAQRDAERAESVEKISSRINRIKRDFVRTRRGSARREDVLNLIEEISSQLDNSREAEDLRRQMRGWEEDFALLVDPREPVEDFAALLRAIQSLAYRAVRTSARTDT
ncbi:MULTISPECIES: hypothetical protein [Protofrankia]|uniref:Uncharacterized protein n=1 Tax=Protofrankia coriariae TaxID=1562887 RepID=A0ABR5EZ73_9ACTN|nr:MULTISPECIES: hypothetical protein [Protofrankia]KLL09765.1 hypothetical protein FrCorBMG51_22700 [Protofrankia coriariae]ONH31795.1 hypothetical protein BL254_22770 [Protofrankia sp. BMG5.30]